MGRLTAFGLYARTVAAGACFLLLGASFAAAENSTPSQGPHVSAASRHGVSPPQRDFREILVKVPHDADKKADKTAREDADALIEVDGAVNDEHDQRRNDCGALSRTTRRICA